MHPAFLRKLLREEVSAGALGELVQHCCFGVQDPSSPVMQCILQGIDTMDAECLQPYLSLFCAYISIEDEHHEWRLHLSMTRLLRVMAHHVQHTGPC